MVAGHAKEGGFNMARYTGAKCRLCRREGVSLCGRDDCALKRRLQAPGQHGGSRGRLSGYGQQLREKQKAKRIYGILEKQFRRYVDEALKTKGVTGEALMQKLETRFDNMVYRSGFAVTRPQSRQFIRLGLFMINGVVNTIPSTRIKVGDIIKPIDISKVQLREGFILPSWLTADVKEKQVKFEKMFGLEEIPEPINIQLIVEYYSR